jgi:hypothetical protein
MARTRAAEHGAGGDGLGGAAHAAPPADPLRLVQAAVAGDDLSDVTRQAAEACGRVVAACLPAFGSPVHWPAAGAQPTQLRQLFDYAGALAADRPAALPDDVVDAVPVRVGPDVVGVVAALGPGHGPADIPVHAWLTAAATAAAITTLIGHRGAREAAGARRSFLEGLELNPPADMAGLLANGRRLGFDLTHGAVGLCALSGPGRVELGALAANLLYAETGAGRLLGLIPLAVDGADGLALEIVASLRAGGAIAACSAPRRSPEQLQDALVEAAVLAELDLAETPAGLAPAAGADGVASSGVGSAGVEPGDGAYAGGGSAGVGAAGVGAAGVGAAGIGAAGIGAGAFGAAQEETYRLLVGVLLRAPAELSRLRELTVAELERYDALHDTELLATLEAFLAHHGSTTETAEAMSLHRHTVGYRLARVQEVAGLSPYESDGRERLSLGLKADRILAAESQRLARARPG